MRPRKPIPDWAQRERTSDLAWINENLHIFWPAAQDQYKEVGRGAIVVNTLSRPLGTGNPFTYLSQEAVEATCDSDVQGMVREYNPAMELVVVLLKKNNKESAYRLMQVGQG